MEGLREQLESLLGPLVHYELVEPSPSAPQPLPCPSSPAPAAKPAIDEEPEWVEEFEVTDGPAPTEPADFWTPWPGVPSGSLWGAAAADRPERASRARKAPCAEVAGDGD